MSKPRYGSRQEVIELYAFGSKLGQGNYGSVRSCMHMFESGPPLACKTITYANMRSFSDLNDIQREVSTMIKLGPHPNLVQLKAVHKDKTGWHLMMELCRGGELFDEVMRRERFMESDAADTLRQVASAVDCCHSKNVLHRDIKLENILLVAPPSGAAVESEGRADADGNGGEVRLGVKVPKKPRVAGKLEVKLADFGLALPLRRGQQVSDVAGSPFYMAPEVVQGQPYDYPADVWSLGVILYALLSGFLPFTGLSNEDIFQAVKRAYIDLDTPAWEGVSPEAKRLVRQMLQEDPSQRPTVKEVLADPWVRGVPVPETTAPQSSRKAASDKGYTTMCEEHGVFRSALEPTPPSASPKDWSWKALSPFQRSSVKPNVSGFNKVPHPPSQTKPRTIGRSGKPAHLRPSSSSEVSPTSTLEPPFTSDSRATSPSSTSTSPKDRRASLLEGTGEGNKRSLKRWRMGIVNRFR